MPGRPLLVITGLDVGRRVGKEERPDAFGALLSAKSDLLSASACRLRRVRKVGIRLGGGIEAEADAEEVVAPIWRDLWAGFVDTATSISATGVAMVAGTSSTGVVDRGACLSTMPLRSMADDRIGDPVRRAPMERRDGETGAGLMRNMPFARLGDTICDGVAAGDLCATGTRAKGRVV